MTTTRFSTFLAAVAFAAGAVRAQEAPVTPPPFSLSVTPTASYAFDADLGDDASVSVGRAGVDVTPAFMAGRATRVSLGFSAEYSRYDFDGLATLDGLGNTGDSPTDALQLVFRPTVAMYFSENFAVFGGPIVVFGGEPDVDIGDSLAFGGLAGFNYQISPGVWVGTGIVVTSQLEDDALVLPLLNLNWKINPEWRLDVTGLSGRLSYAPIEAWTFYLSAAYEVRQFRLGAGAVVPDGVLSDESLPVTLGVDWKVADHFTVGGFGGVIAYRKVEFFDDNQNSLADDTADMAGFVGARFEYSY